MFPVLFDARVVEIVKPEIKDLPENLTEADFCLPSFGFWTPESAGAKIYQSHDH